MVAAPPVHGPDRRAGGPTRLDAGDRIGLREVAARLGVHYMTAYKYVRSGRLPATKVGDEWRVRVADVERFVQPGTGDAVGATGTSQVPGRCDRFRSRLVAGDEGGAWGVVESLLDSGVRPAEILLELLAPALRDVGDAWAAGELSVAGEHRATAVAARVVARLGPALARPGRRRGTVLLGSPSGDRHALPTAILADLLRGAGFEPVDLGADTPPVAFVDAARSADRLVAAVVTVTTTEALAAVPGTVGPLRLAAPGVPVLVGGGAVPDEAASRWLGSDGWARSTGGLVDLLDSLARRRVG